MCAENERAFVFNELTYDQWERRRQQIIRPAEATRARALRGLLVAVLRGLRTAAWAALAAAGKWWRAYIRRRERNAAVRELRAFDDRSLKDIGINRSEIEWVVDGQDATRLRDTTIAANCSRRRDPTAGAGTASRPQPSSKQLIKKHAA
jgi:uncharacterized protein YjiS (DUF1127 family)